MCDNTCNLIPRSSARFWCDCGTPSTIWYALKPNCANATSRNLLYCVYETSHGTGGTECGNQETITSGNVIVRLYCIKISKLYLVVVPMMRNCSRAMLKQGFVFSLLDSSSRCFQATLRIPGLMNYSCSIFFLLQCLRLSCLGAASSACVIKGSTLLNMFGGFRFHQSCNECRQYF